MFPQAPVNMLDQLGVCSLMPRGNSKYSAEQQSILDIPVGWMQVSGQAASSDLPELTEICFFFFLTTGLFVQQ